MIAEEVPAALDGERLDRVVALLADVSRSVAAELIAAQRRGGRRGRGDIRKGSVDGRCPADHRHDENRRAHRAGGGRRGRVRNRPRRRVDRGRRQARWARRAPRGRQSRRHARQRTAGALSRNRRRRTTGPSRNRPPPRCGQLRTARRRSYRGRPGGADPPVRRPHGITALRGAGLGSPVGAPWHRRRADRSRPADPTKMAVVADGRPARTEYEVVANLQAPADVARLECRLETGRTHQIRVHLAAVGHPLVGDVVYGAGRSTLGLDRPFLHAAELSMAAPDDRGVDDVQQPAAGRPRSDAGSGSAAEVQSATASSADSGHGDWPRAIWATSARV